MACCDAFRRGIPIRMLLDNNVNFSGIGNIVPDTEEYC